MEFKHPKYYKELRSRNKELQAATRDLAGAHSDQSISLSPGDGQVGRSTGPGLKLNPKPAFVIKGTSPKHQASSKVGSKAFKIIKP